MDASEEKRDGPKDKGPQPLWWYTFTNGNLYRFHKGKWEDITKNKIYNKVIEKINTIKNGKLMFVMAEKDRKQWLNTSKMSVEDQSKHNLKGGRTHRNKKTKTRKQKY